MAPDSSRTSRSAASASVSPGSTAPPNVVTTRLEPDPHPCSRSRPRRSNSSTPAYRRGDGISPMVADRASAPSSEHAGDQRRPCVRSASARARRSQIERPLGLTAARLKSVLVQVPLQADRIRHSEKPHFAIKCQSQLLVDAVLNERTKSCNVQGRCAIIGAECKHVMRAESYRSPAVAVHKATGANHQCCRDAGMASVGLVPREKVLCERRAPDAPGDLQRHLCRNYRAEEEATRTWDPVAASYHHSLCFPHL